VTFHTKRGETLYHFLAQLRTKRAAVARSQTYEAVIELHVLVKQLLPLVWGKVCCCELVVDLHDDRLTTSSSVV